MHHFIEAIFIGCSLGRDALVFGATLLANELQSLD
jgi:hypothetical protein